MTKLFNNKYLLFGIICVLAVSIVLAFIAGSYETAHADYTEDILNNPEAIVNFNQIFYINSPTTTTYAGITMTTTNYTYSISGTATATDYLWAGVSGINSSHHFYFNAYNSDIDIRVQNFSNHLSSPFIFTGDTIFNFAINFISGQTYDITIKPILIDLDLMFGSSSIPTLEQCNNLFVADYYAYNTGSPVSISGIGSYANGYNDAMGSATIITNSINPATQLFASNTSYWLPQNNTGAVNYTGRAGLYLGYTAQAGNVLKISYTGTVHTNSYLQILYESNGQYIPLVQDLSQFRVGSYSIYNIFETSFTLPITTQYIYFYASDPNDNGLWGSTLVQLSITNSAYNYQTAVADAEKYGYQQAENVYKSQLESYTTETGAGYQSIYQLGYQAGQNANVSEARKKTYTFTAFLGALFDVPVSTIKSLLDFNFLGFNLKNFVFSLLTLSIVFALIKFILVKSAGGGDK